MAWQWSLVKNSAEEIDEGPQQKPIEPIAPNVQPALTNVPAVGEQNQSRQQRVNAIKASPEGAAMRDFMQNPQGDQTITPRKRIELYKQDDLSWRAFVEIAQEALGLNETVNQFIERVTYEAPNRGKMFGEDAQIPNPENVKRPEAAEAEAEAEEDKSDRSEADKFSRPYLDEVGQIFIENHRDFLEEYASRKDNDGNPLPGATEIFDAVENAFGGNARGGGGIKKWKRFYEQHRQWLPRGVQDALSLPDKNVIKAIDTEILNSINAGKEPSSIRGLKSLVKSDDPQVQEALHQFVIQCSRALGKNREGRGELSLNKDLGDGRDVASITPGVEQIEESLPEDQVDGTNNAWDAFLQNPANVEVFNYLRNLSYAEEEDSSMVMDLAKRTKQDPNEIIKEAIHTAYSGWSRFGGRVKWQEFFDAHPDLLPSGATADPDSMNEYSSSALKILSDIGAGHGSFAKLLPSLQDFVISASEDFLNQMYEQYAMQHRGDIDSLIPNMTNLKTLNRIGKLVETYMLREYAWLKARGSTAAAIVSGRRYALLKAKNEQLQIGLGQLLNSNEPVLLTNDRRVFKNADNHLIIQERKTKKGVDIWGNDRIFTDEDISLLQRLARPSQWVSKAIDTMSIKFHDPEMLKRSRDKAKDVENSQLSPVKQVLDNAYEEYITNHPEAKDRLKGWRVQLGNNIKAAREKAGLSIEQVIALSKSDQNKIGRAAGSRITKFPETMIPALENGVAVRYSKADLEKLAEIIGQKPIPTGRVDNKQNAVSLPAHENFYSSPPEYDRFSMNDISDLSVLVSYAFKAYAPFLVHRKKEAIRRGIRNDFFNQNSMYYFLNLMGVHQLFSAKPPIRRDKEGNEISSKDSEAKIGKFLYQLTGRPVGIDKVDISGVKDNLSHVPTESEYEYKIPDFRGPRYKMTPDGQRGEELPPDVVHNYEYDRDKWTEQAFVPQDQEPTSPTDIRRKWHEPDPEQLKKHIMTPENPGEPRRDLAYWEKYTIDKLERHAHDTTPEELEQALQTTSPVEVAKSILDKIWGRGNKGSGTTRELQKRVNNANTYLQEKGIDKKYTIDSYALKIVNDEIRTSRIFREKSIKDLEWLRERLPTMKEKDKIRYLVPVSVRRSAKYVRRNMGGPGLIELNPVVDENGIEKFDSTIVDLFRVGMERLDRLGALHAKISQYAMNNKAAAQIADQVANEIIYQITNAQ